MNTHSICLCGELEKLIPGLSPKTSNKSLSQDASGANVSAIFLLLRFSSYQENRS